MPTLNLLQGRESENNKINLVKVLPQMPLLLMSKEGLKRNLNHVVSVSLIFYDEKKRIFPNK